jgi:hypothetical protein
MISFICQFCRKRLRVDDRHTGRAVNCPGCHQPLIVPAAEPPPAESNSLTDDNQPDEPPRNITSWLENATPQQRPRTRKRAMWKAVTAVVLSAMLLLLIVAGVCLWNYSRGAERSRQEQIAARLAEWEVLAEWTAVQDKSSSGVRTCNRPRSIRYGRPGKHYGRDSIASPANTTPSGATIVGRCTRSTRRPASE